MPESHLHTTLRAPRRPPSALAVLTVAVCCNLLSPGTGHGLVVHHPQGWLSAGFVRVISHQSTSVRVQSAGGGTAAAPATEASPDSASSRVPLSAADADQTSAPSAVPPGLDGQATADGTETQRLLTDSKLQQAQLVDLRQQLAASEAANRWLPWLLLGLVGSLSGLLWAGLRLHRTRREQDQRAWSAEASEISASLRPDGLAATAAPLFLSEVRALPVPGGVQLPGAGLLASTSAGPDQQHPDPLARHVVDTAGPALARAGASGAGAFGSAVPPRPVSVEELLDLEQQVDFFMVLGQEQSAIDLLLGHVRATGGTSALPYFKLLEIYRHQDDEEAYERTRERFNLRFNAAAPDWQGDLTAGRQLDSYLDVVQRLQLVWSSPQRAVAELESLLLRRADLEPFDLPAFHDVLTLHALMLDMSGNAVLPADVAQVAPHAAVAAPASTSAAHDPGNVDLLLPLGDVGMPSTGRQRAGEPVGARAMLAEWVYSRTVTPVAAGAGLAGARADGVSRPPKLDLDLSDFAPAPREFTRPAAFTDIDMRRDNRNSDLAPFDDSDLLPPSISRR